MCIAYATGEKGKRGNRYREIHTPERERGREIKTTSEKQT